MSIGVLLLALCTAAQADTQDHLQRLLSRLSEEAAAFQRLAPKTLATETLRQKSRKRPSRFRPRLGRAATQPPPPRYQNREIVSEYGYTTLEDAPTVLHELRQVMTVDGRSVSSAQEARTTLTLGLSSADDRLKRRLLREFEEYGLEAAATDFGQILLLFTKRRLSDYQFAFAGRRRIGAEEALLYSYRQTAGTAGVTIFETRSARRQRMEGELWVRRSDFVPLRISLTVIWKNGDNTMRDEAVVDYAMSPHGALLPTSVLHREYGNEELVVENSFQYSPFQVFSAEAEITFKEIPLETQEQE